MQTAGRETPSASSTRQGASLRHAYPRELWQGMQHWLRQRLPSACWPGTARSAGSRSGGEHPGEANVAGPQISLGEACRRPAPVESGWHKGSPGQRSACPTQISCPPPPRPTLSDCSTGTRQRSSRSEHSCSNLARVSEVSMCLGPCMRRERGKGRKSRTAVRLPCTPGAAGGLESATSPKTTSLGAPGAAVRAGERAAGRISQHSWYQEQGPAGARGRAPRRWL